MENIKEWEGNTDIFMSVAVSEVLKSRLFFVGNVNLYLCLLINFGKLPLVQLTSDFFFAHKVKMLFLFLFYELVFSILISHF